MQGQEVVVARLTVAHAHMPGQEVVVADGHELVVVVVAVDVKLVSMQLHTRLGMARGLSQRTALLRQRCCCLPKVKVGGR